MLIDFIEVENVLDNPDEFITYSKQLDYYTKENNQNSIKGFYSGVRSKSLVDLNSDLYHRLNTEIFTKCANKIYPDSTNKILYGFGFETSIFFHLLTEQDKPNDTWLHQDPDCIWAGVIYLNKNPQPDSGTIVYRNGEKIIVPNQFNKLVLYSPTFDHMSQGGFGDNLDNGRLTITFFVNAFQFKIKSIINEE